MKESIGERIQQSRNKGIKEYMGEWADGWIDGWMGGWMDGMRLDNKAEWVKERLGNK